MEKKSNKRLITNLVLLALIVAFLAGVFVMKNDLTNSAKKLATAKAAAEELEGNIAGLEDQVSQLKDAAKETKNTIKDYESQIKDLNSKIEELTAPAEETTEG